MAATVVLASGGINSTVTAARAKQGGAVHLLHADYGHRVAGAQRSAARAVAATIGADLAEIELPHVPRIASLKRAVAPAADGSRGVSEVYSSDTVSRVPALMSVLLGAAVQLAHRIGASVVQSGVSELANEIETESAPGQGSPDQGREFHYLYNVMLERLQRSKSPIRLETPLIDLSRQEIIKLGMRYDTPFDLTYSCQAAQPHPCGSCPSCVARTEAFKAAHLIDPAGAASAT